MLALGLWLYVTSPEERLAIQESIGLTVDVAPLPVAEYRGSESCIDCHPKQNQAWQQSHHAHAMEHANADAILGDFNNTVFTYFGRSAHFSMEGDDYFVTTENQQGETQKFKVAYTLGYTPLQQYLVTFPDGRIQTLPFSWDARTVEEGGQRWFHIYGDENIPHNDPLFWTRPLQNWNHMCAQCHTTQFEKNFNDNINQFSSQWFESGVGCEACHGPASNHIAAVKQGDVSSGMSHINKLDSQSDQIDQCGMCHARRNHYKNKTGHEVLSQTWKPSLLNEGLYFPDGQIQDEVFVAGSFMQSKMFAAGVSCTNCHDPHTQALVKEGNGLCTQCHNAETYDSQEHHFHLDKGEGSECVSCHMPERTYMQVDPRRDHRFSVPRPDLTQGLDVPNVCSDCHQNKTSQWAADKIVQHFGDSRPDHFAEAFWQARREQLGAASALEKIVNSDAYTEIVRASAVQAMGAYLNPALLDSLSEQLDDKSALVRSAAAANTASLPIQQRLSLLKLLFNDESRAVRFTIAAVLSDFRLSGAEQAPANPLSIKNKKLLKTLFGEYTAWLKNNLDRAQTQVNLANFYLAQGNVLSAQEHFEKALSRDEMSLIAYLNYADFYRSLDNEKEAEKLLRKALLVFPQSADSHYALGLLLVRTQRHEEALISLQQASVLAPDNSQYTYLYAVAVYSAGELQAGMALLEKASVRFPSNQMILEALYSYSRADGDSEKSKQYAKRLVDLAPWNTQYQQWLKL